MKLTEKRRALIAAVRAHAEANYDAGGWDVVVECYDDEEIAEVIGRARTLKGAIAKFATVIDVYSDRQAAARSEIEAATGGGSERESHFLASSRYADSYSGGVDIDCNCGRTFASVRAADLHVAAKAQEAGTYDRTAQGHHPDGSYVSWRHDEHSGEAWAVRTWEGKGCRAHIEIVQGGDGEYRTVEKYAPAWRGQLIFAGWCDGEDNVPF
jgi:hypothetical protein